nr:MAG TPA: hypothetical protein [Caudoviricetes sp.]
MQDKAFLFLSEFSPLTPPWLRLRYPPALCREDHAAAAP